MSETTEIEKKSLEAHVELCAERYRMLEHKLNSVEDAVAETKQTVEKVNSTVTKMAEKNNDRVIQWGIGIISALVAACTWLLTHYFAK